MSLHQSIPGRRRAETDGCVPVRRRKRARTRTGHRRGAPARVEYWVKVRIVAVGGILSLLFAGMAYKAYGLQVENADKYRKLARRQHLRMVEVPAPRGPILDAQGRELAVTADVDSVYANPRDIEDVTGAAEALSAILNIDIRSVEAKLASRRHFVWIERHVTSEEASDIRSAKLKGVYLTREPRRFYPGRDLAGPLLGFAGIDGKGLDGIELSMDDLLSGQQTRFEAVRDASGRIMMSEGAARSEPGHTIQLSINRSIQHIAETEITAAVVDNDAKAGTLVVLDVHTGAVLAMANWPGYDSNSPGRAVATKARNRAVTDAFEIGSVMKVFTIAAAIDASAVAIDEVIDVEKGRMRIGRKVIRDSHDDPLLNINDIMKRSSNVGATKIARRLGKEGLHAALVDYGFGDKTGIELPGERAGLLRPSKRWGEIGLATVSFGYGLSVTALQVAAGMAAIGNGGVYREPRLIREVRDARGSIIYRHDVEAARRIMRERTARALWPMLHSVFDKGKFRGTAHMLTSNSFDLGGKTGTARKVDPKTRQYSKELYISSFAGLAPIDDPRIAIVVVIDEPRGEHYYGGRVAGPAFVRVADQTLRYLGVPPKANPDATGNPSAITGAFKPGEQRDADVLAIEDGIGDDADDFDPDGLSIDVSGELAGDMVRVPNFKGMSVKRALDVARIAGIAVDMEGAGRAIEQFPPAGPVPWPAECRIVFSPHPRPVTEIR